METPARVSSHGRWRAASLASVYVLMGVHIAHWKIAGRTLAPLELNEVLHTLHLGIVTAGFVFMAVAVLATCVVGRFFCSWGCHILALEDLSAWTLARFGIRPRPLRSRVLLWVPPLALAYLVVWPQVERWLAGSSLPGLRVVTDPEGWTSFVTSDLWRNLPGPGVALLTFFVCGFVIVYVLGSRSFCTYVCPYGALFGAADRIAPGRIVAAGDCTKCGHCTAACQSHIRVHEEVAEFGTVVSASCLRDLDCVKGCPQEALRFGFTRPPLFGSGGVLRRRPTRRFSFSGGEDALLAATFVASLLVFRGLNDSVPFLLSLALAAVFSCMAVLSWRLARFERVRLNNFRLKVAGHLTTTGQAFVALALLLTAFAAHGAFIRYHTFLGQRAFNDLAKSGSDVLAGDADRTAGTASVALSHLETAYGWDWVRPASLRRRLASLYLLTHAEEAAESQLRAVLDDEPDDGEARLRLAELLRSTGRTVEAAAELERLIASKGEVRSRRDRHLRGAAHAALAHLEVAAGRRSDAIRHYELAIDDNPGDADALLALGFLVAGAGELDRAEAYLRQSAALRPDSAAVHNNLGVVFAGQGRDAEAMRHYRISVRLRPDDARVHYNLGMLAYKHGQLEEAAASLRSALDLRPNYAEARAALGETAARLPGAQETAPNL